MKSFRLDAPSSGFPWTLLGIGVAQFALVCVCLVGMLSIHRLPPLWIADPVLLAMTYGQTGRRRWLVWPVAYVAYVLANVLLIWRGPMTLFLPVADVVGVATISVILRRLVGSRPDFAASRDLTLFVLVAGVLGPAVTVAGGVATHALFHSPFPLLGGLTWFGALSLGMLIVAPGLMIMRHPQTRPAPPSAAGVAALALVAVVSVVVFVGDDVSLRYLIVPAIGLAAIFLEFLGVAIGGMIVSVVAFGVAFVDASHGGSVSSERLLWLQVFLTFTLAVNLPFAALLVQRRRLADSLLSASREAERARSVAVEEQRRSKLAEEIAKIGFWTADFVSGEVQWSDANFAIFGRDTADKPVLGSQASYAHPEDRQRITSAFVKLRRGKAFECSMRIVRGGGQLGHVVARGVPEFDDAGAVRGAFGTVADVTELTLAQQALAENAARLRLITENVADIIVQTDLDDVVTYVSPSVEARMGLKPAEVLGRSWRSLIHPDDAVLWCDAVSQLLQSHGADAVESVHCRASAKDGRVVWLAMRPKLVRDPRTGEPVGVVDVARDVTELKRLIRDAVDARAAAEKAAQVKSEFLANMSHEIRTPLTSISGFTRLAQEQGDLSAEARRYIDRISSASSALLAIVNDVLDFSKLEAGEIRIERRPVSVRDMMQETADLFAGQSADKGLAIALDCPRAMPALLMIDPDRLRQVMINLTGNAIKFTEAGGVRLKAAYDRRAARLRMDVIDTGPGVPENRRELLFQRFSQVDGSTTRRFGGTGLGLAICKGLIEAMDGEIGMDPAAAGGAGFWFVLPAEAGVLAYEPDAPAAEPSPLTGVRVLVVDDNRVNRELARMVLEPMGAEVSEAEDGPQAVEQAELTPFDVILMDLRMPLMSGPEAARAIWAGQGPNVATPIVAFSADGAEAATDGATGFAGRVIKPFKPADLILAIRAAMDETPAMLEGRDVA